LEIILRQAPLCQMNDLITPLCLASRSDPDVSVSCAPPESLAIQEVYDSPHCGLLWRLTPFPRFERNAQSVTPTPLPDGHVGSVKSPRASKSRGNLHCVP